MLSSELINDKHYELAKRARLERPGDLAISAIVLHELLYGAYRSAPVEQNLASIDVLQFPFLSFDTQDAWRRREHESKRVDWGLRCSDCGTGTFPQHDPGYA